MKQIITIVIIIFSISGVIIPHLTHTLFNASNLHPQFHVAKEAVKVFQQNSRGENFILDVTEKDTPDLRDLANQLLGKEVFVSWPHLQEAKVRGTGMVEKEEGRVIGGHRKGTKGKVKMVVT